MIRGAVDALEDEVAVTSELAENCFRVSGVASAAAVAFHSLFDASLWVGDTAEGDNPSSSVSVSEAT